MITKLKVGWCQWEEGMEYIYDTNDTDPMFGKKKWKWVETVHIRSFGLRSQQLAVKILSEQRGVSERNLAGR